MKNRRFGSVILWVVYAFVAAATFRHSAWGFGTLESSLAPDVGAFWIIPAPVVNFLTFWGTGLMAAFAVDAGMAGLVFAIRESRGGRWESVRLYVALGVAMAASGFTQLLYAVTHAAPAPLPFNVAPWMLPTALAIWEWRIIVLPLLLPTLGLAYAFTAGMRGGEDKDNFDDEALLEEGQARGPFADPALEGATEFPGLLNRISTGYADKRNDDEGDF